VPKQERCGADGEPQALDPGTYQVILLPPGGFDAHPPARTVEVVDR